MFGDTVRRCEEYAAGGGRSNLNAAIKIASPPVKRGMARKDNSWCNGRRPADDMRGLYIHVPFCVQKCKYCDFYSVASRSGVEEYVAAVLQEAGRYAGQRFDTLYLGGGTPSLLGPKLLISLLGGLKESLDLSGVVEAAIEVNPDSATRELLEAARATGINRVSIGVQSLDDRELKAVGRIHCAQQAIETIGLATRLGFKSVSADLIVGLPGQSWTSLSKSLGAVVEMGVGHLSLYCLSLEEGTPLAEDPPKNLPMDDEQVELFERARALLETSGFVHYEISNFARPGHECLHNLNYWRGGEYVGLGPAAASHLDGKRFKNRNDVDAYVKDSGAQTESIEKLSIGDKACEEVMLRLRLLREGVDAGVLATKFGAGNIAALVTRLDGMVREGALEYRDSCYRLKPARVLTSNPIFAEVLG